MAVDVVVVAELSLGVGTAVSMGAGNVGGEGRPWPEDGLPAVPCLSQSGLLDSRGVDPPAHPSSPQITVLSSDAAVEAEAKKRSDDSLLFLHGSNVDPWPRVKSGLSEEADVKLTKARPLSAAERATSQAEHFGWPFVHFTGVAQAEGFGVHVLR